MSIEGWRNLRDREHDILINRSSALLVAHSILLAAVTADGIEKVGPETWAPFIRAALAIAGLRLCCIWRHLNNRGDRAAEFIRDATRSADPNVYGALIDHLDGLGQRPASSWVAGAVPVTWMAIWVALLSLSLIRLLSDLPESSALSDPYVPLVAILLLIVAILLCAAFVSLLAIRQACEESAKAKHEDSKLTQDQ